MKGLFSLIVIVVLGVFLGRSIALDPGYILVSSGDWLLEMPLWLGGVLAIGGFFLLYFATALITYLWRMPGMLAQERLQRRRERAKQYTYQGFVALAEGRWGDAENLLLEGVMDNTQPLINYISAAQVAQTLGAIDRRDQYLKLAQENSQGMEVTVGLMQARLQWENGQVEQCLATLQHIRSLSPEHPYMLRLLRKVYERLHEWELAIRLLPTLVMAKVLTQDALEVVRCDLYHAWFAEMLQGRLPERKHLEDFWYRLPWTAQQDARLMHLYAKALHQLQLSAEAEAVLRSLIKREWSEEAIAFYGQIKGADVAKQLATAESWLENYDPTPTFLLTLGRLCLYNQLWGKAQRYFEASLGAEARPETYAELARLLEFLGKKEESKQLYQKGLESVCKLVPFPPRTTVLMPY